jgi:hypothetical protein
MLAVNDAINRRDLGGLVALMAESHRFVDSSGGMVTGRDACRQARQGFFERSPDYRNVFDVLTEVGDGAVVATGRSESSVDALRGRAQWRAVVIGDRVDLRQVSEPAIAPS